MSGHTDMTLVNDEGIRIDGRRCDEKRPIKIEAGVLKNADGSCYLEIGKNKVLCAVYGPRECRPRHLQDPTKAIIQCKYNMETYSVSDRKRPGTDRRSVEISKLISEALSNVVQVELFPRASIDVYIEILQANAGTRCAGLTAASVALADAGIPMRDLIPAIACGKADNHVVLDLNKEEDNFGQADVPLAIVPSTDEIVLLQMDGNMTREELDHGLDMAFGAAHEVYDMQKAALKKRYSEIEKKEGATDE
ncbi:MAG: exosome complex exonuclease Rrp41 [Candidatus Methanomethylophilus sp.]|nr:exosome complex exonuclease Rrp41 [Methanomethylophilus sp.]MDD3233312.1 exosome complex exonuclease Rrp41 [Methanomethylophilus sp.]MDD4221576.1 exosome complex exonuclease Rrp41 [Methanomethylophilus sp.]MDD4668721.1 exosome complex exonuclease Rrp41 [Methanomethylophilus sp.]